MPSDTSSSIERHEIVSLGQDLLQAWVGLRQHLHQEGVEDEKWFECKTAFDACVSAIGQGGHLSDVVEYVMGEGIDFIDALEILFADEGVDFDMEVDPTVRFHQDIFLAVDHHLRPVSLEGGAVVPAVSSVMGIPMFGERRVLEQAIKQEDFVQLIRKSGMVDSDTNVVMLGLIPTGDAQHHLVDPQAVYQLRERLENMVGNLDALRSPAGQDIVRQAKEEFSIDLPSSQAAPGTTLVGSYIAVFITTQVMVGIEDDDKEYVDYLGDYPEDIVMRWESNLQEWTQGQGLKEESFNIAHPFLYRDAIAFAMADLVVHYMFMQNSVGGRSDDTVARLEVVVPDTSMEGLSTNDMVQIIGYTQDDNIMGSIDLNAVAAALVHDDMEECWQAWVGASADVLMRSSYHVPNRQRLH